MDGIIVAAQGAGGHTGTINPFALMNEIRAFYDGPMVLAGSISTGRDVLAAQAMGAEGRRSWGNPRWRRRWQTIVRW